MSESDPDAWAQACAEDLQAEKARRRARRGEEPGSPAEEFRKLFEAVADKLSGSFGGTLGGAAAGQAAATVQQVVHQAKALVEPVIERNPQVFDHLAAAGGELLAAYRSAVQGHEARWTRGDTREANEAGAPRPAGTDNPHDVHTDKGGESAESGAGGTKSTRGTSGTEGTPGPRGRSDGPDGPGGPDDDGPATGQHIDLD
ncbi:DUF5304 domain-containing protein [Streptomyces sp. NPDC048718]|uniref:DUF5304 domain-containing protein n=1 Tax=Streptomyces sp. NPDC048718 TaxID=3365587 RepID=UPI003715D104